MAILCGCGGSTNVTPPVTVPGTITFAAAATSASQSAGSIMLTVDRTIGSTAVSVSYATANGTASAGVNYTATSGTLSWGVGDTAPKTITIPISTSVSFTGTLNFVIVLSNPGGGASLGAITTNTVTISPTPVPGTLSFINTSITVAQSSGTASLTVGRTVGSSGTVTVDYGTADATAIAGTNYTSTSGTLRWADGDATAKTITVPINTMNSFSGTVAFTVTLASVTGNATLGTSTALVSITTAGPYTAYSSYYTLPYVGTPSFKALGSTLKVTASIAADITHTGTSASYTLDTGSTGVIVPATELAGYTTGNGTPGSLTYSSSGLKLTGYWTNAVITLPNAKNESGAGSTVTITVPVLAVISGTCTGGGVNSGNCTGTIPHMLGIGFGRGTGTYDSPIYNPFVNLKEMVAGSMRRGYVFTASGIQLGLTNTTVPMPAPFGSATSNTFTVEQLTASNAFSGYAYDWNTSPGSFIYAGTATAVGTILFDTGLTNMILEDVSHASGTTVPNGTAITINAIPGSLSYSFVSGDGGATTPSSVAWASETHGAYVNVGIHFLGKYDYLYDADGGILGLRPVAR
ncbi:MAG TPA: Calx-beta domain-containing protein [Acidobacteriaceae bacterium]